MNNYIFYIHGVTTTGLLKGKIAQQKSSFKSARVCSLYQHNVLLS